MDGVQKIDLNHLGYELRMYERDNVFTILIDEIGKGTVKSIFIDKNGIEVLD